MPWPPTRVIDPPRSPTIGWRSRRRVAPRPMMFWTTISTTLMPRNTSSRGPPLTSIRASAASPTVVKNIRRRVSFRARLKPSLTPRKPSTRASSSATTPPPTTGAGMFRRRRIGTEPTRKRPRKNTPMETISVETRSNPTVRTVAFSPPASRRPQCPLLPPHASRSCLSAERQDGHEDRPPGRQQDVPDGVGHGVADGGHPALRLVLDGAEGCRDGPGAGAGA